MNIKEFQQMLVKLLDSGLPSEKIKEKLLENSDDSLREYICSEDVTEEALLVQGLYSYQIKLLKEKKRRNIYIEFDSIERISDLMLDWLPYTKKPLLRYQKRILI